MSSDLTGHLDSPAPGESIYDAAIFLSGWVYAPDHDPAGCRIRAFLEEDCVAETRLLFTRPDVCRHLALSPCVPTGFRMLGKTSTAASQARESTLRLAASYDEGAEQSFVRQRLRLLPAALETRPHGAVVRPDNTTLLHRENIYGSGPPVEQSSEEVARLISEYLPPNASVVDVGCGAGVYAPGLIARGHPWLGLEINPHCAQILERQQLPYRRVDLAARRLPCADQEWDCAICIEVLEHISEPEIFLREIRRAIRRRALFSVPNIEVLAYLHDWGVVPWHMLEADHKNFFTRASLRSLLGKSFRRIEVFPYAEHPLRTRDRVALHMHLFAVADA
jgi:2-polyprenyl-3-methyl-5-hydroxy-6-metoxy-1,4-benzoquinol methylase